MQSAAHGDALSAGAAEGFSYSRVADPTLDVLERRIAALEGGRSAVAFASGMAAVSAALLCAAEGGGRIITARNLYSASVDAMDSLFPEFGIETDFVDDINDLALVELLIGPDTRAIFAESVANPSTEVADVAALASVAHRHGIPLIIDNTVPTPYLFRPIELGADVRREPVHRGRRCRRARQRRASAWHPAHHRQHGTHALPVPADRTGGRRRRAFAHEGDRRAWQCARRHRRRCRAFRLGHRSLPAIHATGGGVSDDCNDGWHSFASKFGIDAYIRRVRISNTCAHSARSPRR